MASAAGGALSPSMAGLDAGGAEGTLPCGGEMACAVAELHGTLWLSPGLAAAEESGTWWTFDTFALIASGGSLSQPGASGGEYACWGYGQYSGNAIAWAIRGGELQCVPATGDEATIYLAGSMLLSAGLLHGSASDANGVVGLFGCAAHWSPTAGDGLTQPTIAGVLSASCGAGRPLKVTCYEGDDLEYHTGREDVQSPVSSRTDVVENPFISDGDEKRGDWLHARCLKVGTAEITYQDAAGNSYKFTVEVKPKPKIPPPP